MRPEIESDLAARIAAWRAETNLALLRAEWQRLHGVEPARRLGRTLLLLGVAYRLQEKAAGGLSPAIRRKLAASPDAGAPGTAAPPLRLKPGTTLLRVWQGATHAVRVTETGFEHDGRSHASLSAIARAITGAHWSGPRFFGLRARKRPDAVDAA
jgi:hypothetical protein